MENNRKKILAISGSTRKNSSNNAILESIAKKYANDLEVDIYDKIDELPHFNPDKDNDNLPKEIQAFREMIQAADGVLICTPEYVFSLPGSLKNAIEWNVSTVLFSRKPVALIVAAASGEKAMESLNLIMTTLEASIPEESKLIIKGAKGKVDADGNLIDNHTLDQLDQVVSSLISSMQNVKNKALY